LTITVNNWTKEESVEEEAIKNTIPYKEGYINVPCPDIGRRRRKKLGGFRRKMENKKS